MFHWLSDDIVRFKIEVGDEEKFSKMQHLTHTKWPFPQHAVADDAIFMAYISTQHSASKYTITACRAKVKFKVSVWT